MRIPQFRLRTLMIVVAVAALVLMVIIQGVQLQRAAVREQLARALAERDRAFAEMALMKAQMAIQKVQAAGGQEKAVSEKAAGERKPR
jgi:hypothetical protein